MKNFKKIIFLGIIVVLALGYIIYNYIQTNSNDVIEEDIYVNVSENIIEEKNTIILHITGEVKAPRNYRN